MQDPLSTTSNRRSSQQNHDPAVLRNIADLQSGTFRNFDQRLNEQIERLQADCDVILNRKRRNLVSAAIQTLKEIRTNILADPMDIQEESTLPVVVKELADALNQYVLLLPHKIPAEYHLAQSQEIERIFSQADTWLRQILERMVTNDSEGLSVRVQTLSSVFERGARLHDVQKDIRASLRNKEK